MLKKNFSLFLFKFLFILSGSINDKLTINLPKETCRRKEIKNRLRDGISLANMI